jgi:hypothetical protein
MTKIKIGNKAPLVKNLLFVEGIGRAGKFLLANILNGFPGIEPVQQHSLLEQVPFWEKSGLIEPKTARELLRSEIDTYCYEMLIGRNFNYRIWDKSSIFNIPNYKKFLARSKEKDVPKIMKQFNKKKPTSFFILHELIPNVNIYFETFPELKVISIRRNPVDLVSSWYKRRLGKAYLTDPRIAKPMVQGKHGPVLWFLYKQKDVYHELSEMDRVILSIKVQFDMYETAIRNLSNNFKKRILFISYEDVLSNPKKVIKIISGFLGKKPLPEMKLVLKREKLPVVKKLESGDHKLEEIKKIASKKYFNVLLKLKKKYEEH